MATSMSE